MEYIDARRGLWIWLVFVALALNAAAQGDVPQAGDGGYKLIELETEALPSLSIARSGHVTLCLDGELTVLGGHTDGFVPTPTAEYYRDGAWHAVPLVYLHDQAAVVRLRSGKVFLAGGHKEPLGIEQMFSAELYDPATHSSQGFGCMYRKRAFANAVEMGDGQVAIAGNWYAGDCIEMFADVDDPSLTNADSIKGVAFPRAMPYIMRISGDDAIIFGAFGNKGDAVDCGIVDRLKGPAYSEPFLEAWRPVGHLYARRADNQFIGNEAQGRYEWLLPVEDAAGRVAIARVKGPAKGDSIPAFSLLAARAQVPDSIQGRRISYSSLVCDRDRGIAYLIGDNDEARVIVVAIPYDSPEAAPLDVYVTEPQPFVTQGSTPVLTPEGDLVFAGGHLTSNFSPSSAVVRLPLGQASAPAAGGGHGAWRIWVIITCLIACAVAAMLLARRHRRGAPEAMDCEPGTADDDALEGASLDKALPKDEILADLFKRIEQLMDGEKIYLDANLRASDVAARVGSNTAYVSAAINSQRGCSFTQLLTAYRIAHAQELMRQDPDSKISTVSALSGFSTDSTFFRAFRSLTGMSPKEWLSTIRGERQP